MPNKPAAPNAGITPRLDTTRAPMKKFSTSALALWALVIGIGGGYLLGWYLRSSFAEKTERNLEIRVQEDKGDAVLRALKHIQAGSTNAVPFLESQLDDVVLMLGPFVAVPSAAGEPMQSPNLMLAKIRDYRVEFPHSSSQGRGTDDKIAEIFGKIDEKH